MEFQTNTRLTSTRESLETDVTINFCNKMFIQTHRLTFGFGQLSDALSLQVNIGLGLNQYPPLSSVHGDVAFNRSQYLLNVLYLRPRYGACFFVCFFSCVFASHRHHWAHSSVVTTFISLCFFVSLSLILAENSIKPWYSSTPTVQSCSL